MTNAPNNLHIFNYNFYKLVIYIFFHNIFVYIKTFPILLSIYQDKIMNDKIFLLHSVD